MPPPAQVPEPSPDAPGGGTVTVTPVRGLGEIREGDDLAALLAAALRPLAPRAGDVLCLSTKVVSKALGLRVDPARREEAIRAAAVRTVARRLHTRQVTSVVQISSGPVMAAAGVDSSNAPDGPLLLPEDPDACARELRDALTAHLGVELGLLLTDTSSRIWRVGVGDIALGAAGVAALQDLRGALDADGRELTVTVRNLADELAAAADLVKGKANGIPAALVRGWAGPPPATSRPGSSRAPAPTTGSAGPASSRSGSPWGWAPSRSRSRGCPRSPPPSASPAPCRWPPSPVPARRRPPPPPARSSPGPPTSRTSSWWRPRAPRRPR
ncbi:coenzyme F420-0:L-glutamate ligase [Brachybacterium sp. UNK5269]|uniref:coenzyme F420-0:L-glutamate ligase n=1 Tax=Brachybacterium sp. UNK5269 TaxID=3408576 RepID=UPI003BB0F7E1